jgi:hypothetical protein
MTLLTEPTRIVLAKGYSLPDDADAVAYIAAVEAADGQVLETATRMAINSFVKGCKADGIWTAIKASCILAGARTLSGALMPLTGAAPTNFNFVSGDYNRKTGLLGNGSTKYLNSNRNNNADPQNSKHLSIFISGAASVDGTVYIGARPTGASNVGAAMLTRATSSDGGVHLHSATLSTTASSATGFRGASRSESANFLHRSGGSSVSFAIASQSPADRQIAIFALMQDNNSTIIAPTNARLAFYSIGESLDLALLDTRVTTLINAFAAAIP